MQPQAIGGTSIRIAPDESFFKQRPMRAPAGQTSPENHAPISAMDADYRRLFTLSLDLLCVAGLDGYFKQVNPSWTRVLGWTEAELLSRPVEAFMHPDDRERTLQARARLARGIPVVGLENRYLCKDGSYRWLSWQSILEPVDGRVFAVARDITERRQLDHEQIIMSKLESTGLLAGGIAHDFNNLLTGVLLNLGMVNLVGDTNAEQQECLNRAQAALDDARTLTERLLTIANRTPPDSGSTDLRKVLRISAELALRGSKLRSDCVISPDLWPASVNEAQIGQVVLNLLLNAREAAPGGEVRLEAENVLIESLQNRDLTPGPYVRLRVSDNGVGIHAEVLPKIFDPYFSTKERGAQRGMGLGLTICRTIVQQCGGQILVESRPGVGTTVMCHVPALRD